MLEDFLKANGMKARLIECTVPVPNCKAAAAAMGVTVSDIVKSVLFVYDNPKGKAVLLVLLGDARVSLPKVSALLDDKALQLAMPKEVLEMTGYDVGGVPPISIYGVKTFIDEKVMKKAKVYAGGGDEAHLLEITPVELLEFALEPVVTDVTE